MFTKNLTLTSHMSEPVVGMTTSGFESYSDDTYDLIINNQSGIMNIQSDIMNTQEDLKALIAQQIFIRHTDNDEKIKNLPEDMYMHLIYAFASAFRHICINFTYKYALFSLTEKQNCKIVYNIDDVKRALIEDGIDYYFKFIS